MANYFWSHPLKNKTNQKIKFYKKIENMSKERISDLRKSLNGKEYGKRYSIWQKILEEATKLDFQFKCELYSDFVQEFPFTYHEWNDFAQLYAKNNDRTSALKM